MEEPIAADHRDAEARLVAAFRQHRSAQQITIASLAQRTQISRDRMQRLLAHEGQRFHIDEAFAVAEALGMPQGDVMRLLWPQRYLPEIVPLTGRSRASLEDLVENQVSPDLAPTAQLVRGLTQSPNWGFSVSPVFRGPSSDVVIRTINRVTLTPVDRDLQDADHDGLRQQFLSEFGSLPAGVSFTQQDATGEVAEFAAQEGAANRRGQIDLACSVFAADRPVSSVPVDLRAAQHGLAVVALRGSTRPLSLAAILARAFGWGLLSSARTGRLISRHAIADARASAAKENLYANIVLGELLAACTPHTVISHVGNPVVDEEGKVLEEHSLLHADPKRLPFIVLVSESDDLLLRATRVAVNARGDRSRFTFEQLQSWRDQLRTHVLELQAQGRGVVIEARPSWTARTDLDRVADAQLRWRDLSQYSRLVVQDLFHRSGLRRNTFACRDAGARAVLAFDSPVTWH